jgi:hypothetical protein
MELQIEIQLAFDNTYHLFIASIRQDFLDTEIIRDSSVLSQNFSKGFK